MNASKKPNNFPPEKEARALKFKKLSIIIPCYNEAETFPKLLKKVEAVDISPLEKEIVIIDDYSTDGTRDFLKTLKNHTLLYNKENHGKGYSINKGIQAATGDIILIQDADLEYDPGCYPELIAPILKGKTEIIYGSRERNNQNKVHSGVCFYLGGLFLTWLTNLLYRSSLTDQATCYKVFTAKIIKDLIPLQEERFGFCSEVTCKLLRKKIPIQEVAIQYYPRKKEEGKKISWIDGARAIYLILKYRIIPMK